MTVIEADGFQFQFNDAIEAFIFDEKNISSPYFHGVPMKCVDIIVEFIDFYLYIEIKDFHDTTIYDVKNVANEEDKNLRKDKFNWLNEYLKYKYRDSYLYRYAENKVDKPINYMCLLSFNNALNSLIQKRLKQELPVGKASLRWQKSIVTSCQVLNITKWNENFPKWPVIRLSKQPMQKGI